MGRQYQGMDRDDLVSSARAAEETTRSGKGDVVKLSVVPQRPHKVMGWTRFDYIFWD